MNRYDSRNWESNLWEPVVQTWQPCRTRYHSPFEYTSDPVAAKVVQVWNSRECDRGEYSSINKAYYPVVPYNTQSFHYSPVMGQFDFIRLKQTDVLDLIYSRKPPPNPLQVVSLAHTISPLLNKMGTIKDSITGQNVGTCTLIANNLVLVARHAVEGGDIRNLNVRFGYTEFNGSFDYGDQTSFHCVIEENVKCDYAIIQLKQPLGSRLGFVSLSIEGHTTAEPALLHYPLGKPLKVSVHTLVQTQYQNDYLLAYHDSDYFSSGGAYFDPMGRMIAMHLGAELEGEMMNLPRYALPLEAIVRLSPHSLLGKLARGELPQAHAYTTHVSQTYLAPTNHNYLIDEEGRESEKILRNLLTNQLKKDKKIQRNNNRTISFSKSNLEYISDKYERKYDLFEETCLGITGVHGFTRLYSVTGLIESDHTLPHIAE